MNPRRPWQPWRLWRLWRLRPVVRRLEEHARREGAEPPPDLLARLQSDIPSHFAPGLAARQDADPTPDGNSASPPTRLGFPPPRDRRPAAARPSRRARPPRWTLVAASLAVVATAGLVALRVEQGERPRAALLAPWAVVASRHREPAATVSTAGSTAAGKPVAEPGSRSEPLAASARPTSAPPPETPAAPSLVPTTGTGADRSTSHSAETPNVPPSAVARLAPLAAPAPRAMTPPPRGGIGGPDADGLAGAELPPEREKAAARETSAAPVLRSTFGGSSGTAAYERLRADLLEAGRLPAPGAVRVDQLANAFAPLAAAGGSVAPRPKLRFRALSAPAPPIGNRAASPAKDAPTAGAGSLTMEGARLPVPGRVYLVRLTARGLASPASMDAVEVSFDPALVARARRVGATAENGEAVALYEVELRPAGRRQDSRQAAPPREAAGPGTAAPAAAPASPASPSPASAADADPGAASRTAKSRSAASPSTTAQGVSAPAAASTTLDAPPAFPDVRELAALGGTARREALAPSAADQPFATVRIGGVAPGGRIDRLAAVAPVPATDPSTAADSSLSVDGSAPGTSPTLPGLEMRLRDLDASWLAAPASLRLQGLAIQLAEAVAAPRPVPAARWQELSRQAAALVAELPADPRVAELRRLVDRAAELAAGGSRRHAR